MKDKMLGVLLVVTFLVAIFLWTGILPIWAQGDAGIFSKLNKILDDQSEIIRRLDEIKSDLSDIKLKL